MLIEPMPLNPEGEILTVPEDRPAYYWLPCCLVTVEKQDGVARMTFERPGRVPNVEITSFCPGRVVIPGIQDSPSPWNPDERAFAVRPV